MKMRYTSMGPVVTGSETYTHRSPGGKNITSSVTHTNKNTEVILLKSIILHSLVKQNSNSAPQLSMDCLIHSTVSGRKFFELMKKILKTAIVSLKDSGDIS